jgi:hypothetical protein
MYRIHLHFESPKGFNIMGFFSNILEKLGLKKDKDEEKAASAPAAAAKKADPTFHPTDKFHPTGAPAAAGAANARAVPEVDVVAKLEKMAAGSGLDWKVSIVDMLKVLGIDSSKDARIELAKELGCPADLIGGDYSKMNVWLHKEVLRRIAANGGNIPGNLLD